MTSRERLLCAMSLGTPDRVPVAPWGLGRLDPDSYLAEELIEQTDIILEVGIGINPYLGAAAQVDTHTEGNRTITTFHTPQGPLRSVIEHTDVTAARREFPCKSYADAEKVLFTPYRRPTVDLKYRLQLPGPNATLGAARSVAQASRLSLMDGRDARRTAQCPVSLY